MNSPLLPRGAPSLTPIPRSLAPPLLPLRPLGLASTRRRRSLSAVSSGGMTGETAEGGLRNVRTVTISYSELMDKKLDLSAKIEKGFGANGLGILSISDVPEFPPLRKVLLHLAPRIASLPEDAKRELEDSESRYNFGWCHGKEKVESGKLDTLKGSFYANPILDVPTTNSSLIQRYPSYCRPNKWPTTRLPELEGAFKALGKLILDVGLLLAYHCDKYVSKDTTVHHGEALEDILFHSRCHKGRLLYYFPRQQSECSEDNLTMSSWCGWHTDHGSLTGLTSGVFTRNAVQVSCPDHAAGLYVKTRNNETVKVVFFEDEIAYQIGETTEILSRGRLCATPHCVKAPNGQEAFGLERSTFALFMQPDWEQVLRFPKEVHLHQELIPPGRTLTFGEYSEMLLNKYYHHRNKGIDHKFASPKTPEQNRIVERKNRTLVEMARTLLIESQLPRKFWTEVVNTSCYVLNRVMVRPVLKETSYELLKGIKKKMLTFL